MPFWVALRSFGRDGVAEMIERHCRQARLLARALRASGAQVLNRVMLNQVLFRLDTDSETDAFCERVIDAGRIWIGPSKWRGRKACRLSVSNWQSDDDSIAAVIELLTAQLSPVAMAAAPQNDPA